MVVPDVVVAVVVGVVVVAMVVGLGVVALLVVGPALATHTGRIAFTMAHPGFDVNAPR